MYFKLQVKICRSSILYNGIWLGVRFDSPLPSKKDTFKGVFFVWQKCVVLDENRRRCFSRSSPKAAIGFWDCEVSSNADFSQPLGTVEKSRGAEYPPSPTKKKSRILRLFLFVLLSIIFSLLSFI